VDCPQCGTANDEDKTFCAQCGTSLSASAAGGAGVPDAPDAPAEGAPATTSAVPDVTAGTAEAAGAGTTAAGTQAPDQTLVTIGDIVVTPTQVITPTGTRPITEVSWSFQDMSQTQQAIPTWAIVCAIVFFLFCLLGLLFLLAKEERTRGWVQVTVQGTNFVHTVQVPVSSVQMVSDINARVNYARSISVNTREAS
jgi:Double zinc ribbon